MIRALAARISASARFISSHASHLSHASHSPVGFLALVWGTWAARAATLIHRAGPTPPSDVAIYEWHD